MSATSFIIAAAFALPLLFVLWLIRRAPEGRQDREGFHDRPVATPAAEGDAGGPEIRKVG